MGESLGWACHPCYIMQGIQNFWELPEETLSQTSSKKIGKFPHATYKWVRKEKKKMRKHHFTQLLISVTTLQILLKSFSLKPLLVPSPRGEQLP